MKKTILSIIICLVSFTAYNQTADDTKYVKSDYEKYI